MSKELLQFKTRHGFLLFRAFRFSIYRLYMISACLKRSGERNKLLTQVDDVLFFVKFLFLSSSSAAVP